MFIDPPITLIFTDDWWHFSWIIIIDLLITWMLMDDLQFFTHCHRLIISSIFCSFIRFHPRLETIRNEFIFWMEYGNFDHSMLNYTHELSESFGKRVNIMKVVVDHQSKHIFLRNCLIERYLHPQETHTQMYCFSFNRQFFFTDPVVIHRCIDDIFLTSNSPIDDLHRMLETANQRHANIKLIHEIHSIVSFLNVRIKKKHDQLLTIVS